MGDLIKNFTFDRNTLKRNTQASADATVAHIEKVKKGERLDKIGSNIVGALAHYMGLFVRKDGTYVPTKLAEAYMSMYKKNPQDAFQWLLTRALWRFHVPNGTACSANAIAHRLGVEFNFFYSLVSLLTHLQALPGIQRFLFYEEFCSILDNDAAWTQVPADLFTNVLSVRAKNGLPKRPRKLLEELEPTYGVGRDNLNGLLNKALAQTGLFDYHTVSDSQVGIALSSSLTLHLQRRVRYLLDHPVRPHKFDPADWERFMEIQQDDLPQETTTAEEKVVTPEFTEPQPDITGMSKEAQAAITACGIRVERSLLERLIAALLAKRLVILTGMSGSGKTRVGQAFAAWLCPGGIKSRSPFEPGTEITSDRISYFVHSEDALSVEFCNDRDPEKATKVILPKEMIDEWVQCITDNAFSRDTSARQIREAVKPSSKFSDQLHSFETHLKAAAFHQLEFNPPKTPQKQSLVAAVGADWTNREPILGYPDALTPGAYRMPPSGVLQLILSAKGDPDRPYFLILDEMNLSHVERYFADVLSAMESEQPVCLHEESVHKDSAGEEVPSDVLLPSNLFIIGTVNVDETTYMFSPKVLDRANVIEFSVSKPDILQFLEKPAPVDLSQIQGKGAVYAQAFVSQAARKDTFVDELKDTVGTSVKDALKQTLGELFGAVATVGAEFGYRPVYEISRFIYFYSRVVGEGWKVADALDAAIMQKLLPKLHGSKTKLGPVITELKKIITKERFPISFAKIERMEHRLKQNGFTSYTEA